MVIYEGIEQYRGIIEYSDKLRLLHLNGEITHYEQVAKLSDLIVDLASQLHHSDAEELEKITAKLSLKNAI